MTDTDKGETLQLEMAWRNSEQWPYGLTDSLEGSALEVIMIMKNASG